MPLFDVVLVPTDFSDIADRATALARDIALAQGARVVLLHAVRDPDYTLEQIGMVVDSMRSAVLRVARDEIEARARRLREDGVVCDTSLVVGTPEKEIVIAIETWHADLVVMGTHGRSRLERLFVGSVAQRVLARANRPVLLVPPGVGEPIVLGR